VAITKTSPPLADTEHTIKVTTHGMDNRSIKMLFLTIEKNYHGLIELVKSADIADADIIDLDGSKSDTLLQNFQKNSKQHPTIFISIRHRDIKNAVFIRKPINIPILLKTIRELTNGKSPEEINCNQPVHSIAAKQIKINTSVQKADAHTKTTANALSQRAADNSTTARVMKRSGLSDFAGLYFNPDDYALGALLKAIDETRKLSSCIKLTCWNKPFIVFNPARNEEILTNMSEGMLRNLGVMRTIGEELCIESEILGAEEFSALLQTHRDSLRLFPAQAFIWKLTLLTARGRVPEGTDLMQPVYLQHWPNMTRLEPIPHGLQIAALWAKQPRPLLSMFAILGIPFDHILNLYSAANAIGLAGPANRQVDSFIEPDSPKEHQHRGLFSSLLHKLSGKS